MQRLKIAQQIIIVLLFAVLIPFVTIGLIISNISQQSVRRELNYSALEMSRTIGENIQAYLAYSQKKLDEVSSAITFIPYATDRADYLTEIESKDKSFKNFEIVELKDVPKDDYLFNKNESSISLYSQINDEYALCAKLDVMYMQNAVSERYKEEKRQIYILSNDNALIATNAPNAPELSRLVNNLPSKRSVEKADLFNKYKNQPSAYYTLEKPSWTVIVNTTENITNATIDKARFRIILALTLAAFFIIAMVGFYTFYLYINIRQLFKGIIAISKGSYERKIHLLKSAFTPHEIVFLAKEFNYMAKKIHQSYHDLSEKNIELERLNEFRTNLVNAISHEFRTPLTSIVGYSSRLLRHDIKIDEQTRIKSLKIIKQQAQRLSRMVEDLLVVPDIESFSIQLNKVEINLAEALENSVLYANSNNSNFDVEISKDLKEVYADSDRLEQVLINLCDNAVKYNQDDEPIKIVAKNVNGRPCVSIKNKSLPIPDDMKEKLFDKFIRMDCELTRTTRGTGLGLYIVKGLCAAMDIDLILDCDDNYFNIMLVFNDYVE
ncbi:TPA: hypothetical protein IAA86_01520 [Candidatus Galligastranaerophilus intestinavium]|uniref:histidine kinase n=1 Tax=Candidatus Galligastranaerophilus intestinavium TaxID=2840836 RepID=A0A9D1FHI8_9BACT|nr:hypothetical protein [Candidatus Galligastranaerophilus intestinavium]